MHELFDTWKTSGSGHTSHFYVPLTDLVEDSYEQSTDLGVEDSQGSVTDLVEDSYEQIALTDLVETPMNRSLSLTSSKTSSRYDGPQLWRCCPGLHTVHGRQHALHQGAVILVSGLLLLPMTNREGRRINHRKSTESTSHGLNCEKKIPN